MKKSWKKPELEIIDLKMTMGSNGKGHNGGSKGKGHGYDGGPGMGPGNGLGKGHWKDEVRLDS